MARTRRAKVGAALLLLLFGHDSCRVAEPRSLPPPGSVEEALLEINQVHEYRVDMGPGQGFFATFEQLGVDVAVEVESPDGKVWRIDSPSGAFGPELVCLSGNLPGTYRIGVRALDSGNSGRYSISTGRTEAGDDKLERCVTATALWLNALPEDDLHELLAGAAERIETEDREILRLALAADLWVDGDQPFHAGMVFWSMGRRWRRLNELKKAAKAYQKAAALFREIDDARQLAVTLNSLASVFTADGETNRAEQALEEVLQISSRLGDPLIRARAFNNRGILKRRLGYWHDAAADYQQALQIFRDQNRRSDAAAVLHNLGICYRALGEYPAALVSFEQSVAIQRALQQNAEDTLGEIALVHHLRGESLQAVEILRQALSEADKFGDWETAARLNGRIGEALSDLGRFEEAMRHHQNALESCRAGGDKSCTTYARVRMGSTYQKWGRAEKALQILESAVAEIEASQDPSALAHVLVLLARAQRGLGDLEAARQTVEEALRHVRSTRSLAYRSGAYLRADTIWQDYYEFYVDLLMELNRLHPGAGHDLTAFEVADLAKGRNFFERLQESNNEFRQNADPRLHDRERAVQAELKIKEDELTALQNLRPNPPGLEEVRRELVELQLKLEEIQSQMRAHPWFRDLERRTKTEVGEVQGRLAPDTLLLSFSLGEQRSFLFVVGKSSFTSHILPPRREIEQLSRAVYRGLSVRWQRNRTQTEMLALQLSERLLGPAADSLSARRLIVVADGSLHYVPFGYLPLPASLGHPEQALIDRYEVVSLPLAAVLEPLQTRADARPPRSKLLAVLADPLFSMEGPLPITEAARQPRFTGEPPPLPFTRDEAQAIADLAPAGQVLIALGSSASRDLALSGVLSEYRILHFATHAVIDEEFPNLSRILLSNSDESGRPVDGELQLHEIFQLDLPADLAVLSACQSALGEQVRGEGLIGFTQGFFYAGVSRLLVTLWSVDDEATSKLMIDFYQGLLLDRLSPAAALRRAQLKMRSRPRFEQPYYWAPFVLQGDWR